ncbi:MAG: polysaccharide biosynthesis tyrosine autokinase, partial [Candidatus Eremiobacteraeota bacterium]|nr:polysaccharide biosynthesis tyrosine autokinase [Candidatus Eremiobacteraeota bacterium]
SGVQSAETYAELFQETPVAQRVIADLNLHASPGQLLKNTTVKPVTNTSILTLGVTWSSPDVSAAIANDFGKVIIDRQRELVAAQASSAIKFLQQQIPEAEARERDAAAALARFEAANHIADISQQTQNTITELASLDAQVSKAQVDHEQSAAQLGSVRGQMSGVSQTINGGTSVAPNPVVAQLQQQLSQVNVQLDTARRQYTEQHPAVIALENQQAQLKREIASTPPTIVSSTNTVPNPEYQQLEQQATQLQSQESADTAQIAALKNQEKALNPTLAALPAQENQLADLQRNAKSAQDVLAALQQKYDDAEVAKTTALSDVTITQPASAQSAAVSPNLLMNTVIAVFLGTILALGGALLVDYFDNSIKTESEAEQRLSLPNLGTIPLVKLKDGTPALPWVRSLAIESFLQLVTSLRYSSDTPLRTISITSPSQGDGKSTIALNTAIALAELEPRVLLIDADLRRPTLHTKLGVSNEIGLSDILVGRKNVRDTVLTTRYGGLDVLPSGRSTPNPIKLLESMRMDQLIDQALEQYKYVIFDNAACSVNLDSAVISRKADGTVLVVAAGSTDGRLAHRAVRRLEQVGVKNILGFVLNRVEPERSDYDAGYYLSGAPSEETADNLMINA